LSNQKHMGAVRKQVSPLWEALAIARKLAQLLK